MHARNHCHTKINITAIPIVRNTLPNMVGRALSIAAGNIRKKNGI
jgi:hypothetical protein